MVSRKVLPIDGAATFVVVVVFLVPSVTAFHDKFMKRCLDFKETQANCDKAWKLFEQAYVGKDPTKVKKEDYQPLLDAFPFSYPCEKTLLYSNTGDVVFKFDEEGVCYMTIWETLLGKILDDVKWCGKINSPETLTDKDCESTITTVTSFWEMASIRIAEHACKDVTVILKGKVPGKEDVPYDPNSFLKRFEVPYLKNPGVDKLIVILLVDEKKTQCNDETLKNLKNDLKEGIQYVCKEVLTSEVKKCTHKIPAEGVCPCKELFKV